jgi:hypothetical protein
VECTPALRAVGIREWHDYLLRGSAIGRAKAIGQIDLFGNVQILSSTLSTEVSVLGP